MTLEFLKTEWAYMFGAFVTLLFIIDPFAIVPVYLTLTNRFVEQDRRIIRRKSCLMAFGILAFFAISGMKFFEIFGITLPAFQIAGGILLLIIGVQQLTSDGHKKNLESDGELVFRDEIAIFPLGTPLLAGPGAISTIILFSTKASSYLRLGELLFALASCMYIIYLTLAISRYLYRALGETGINLISRIMGIVLTAVAVQFILNGIKDAILPWFKT